MNPFHRSYYYTYIFILREKWNKYLPLACIFLDPYAAKDTSYYELSYNILIPLLFFFFFLVLNIGFVYVHGSLDLLMVDQIVF